MIGKGSARLRATCASSSSYGDNYKAHLQVLLDRINSINHANSTERLSNVENNKDYKICNSDNRDSSCFVYGFNDCLFKF